MVTIISAIYKSERYLPDFLQHAKKFAAYLTERKFSIEILIVPTLPSAREKELLKIVENEPWCRVEEFTQPGLYKAWNFGVSKARGELMGPWNADDVRFPEAVIEAQALANAGAEVVYFPFYLKRYMQIGPFDIPVITRKVQGQALTFEKRKFETGMIAGPHFMFTKQAFARVGPFDEQFKIAGDFDWCARAASLGILFALGANFSGIFRVDGHGLSAGKNDRLRAENNIIYQRRNAMEKSVPGIEQEMSAYRAKEIFYKGNWQELK